MALFIITITVTPKYAINYTTHFGLQQNNCFLLFTVKCFRLRLTNYNNRASKLGNISTAYFSTVDVIKIQFILLNNETGQVAQSNDLILDLRVILKNGKTLCTTIEHNIFIEKLKIVINY